MTGRFAAAPRGGARGGEPQAAEEENDMDAQRNPLIQLLPFILIFGIFYLLLIMPMRKRQKKHQEMLGKLTKGDRVVTTGGIFGTVVGVEDDASRSASRRTSKHPGGPLRRRRTRQGCRQRRSQRQRAQVGRLHATQADVALAAHRCRHGGGHLLHVAAGQEDPPRPRPQGRHPPRSAGQHRRTPCAPRWTTPWSGCAAI